MRVHSKFQRQAVMLPSAITHHKNEFCLKHLQQKIFRFSWRDKSKQNFDFSTRLRFSDHCYSETLEGPAPKGAYTIIRPDDPRIFDERRYNLSFDARDLAYGLLQKPGTFVFEVDDIHNPQRRNWTMFSLQTREPLETGERYSVFFSLRRTKGFVSPDGAVGLDMFIQSAYPKSRPTKTAEHLPFGRIAERMAKK